MRPINYQPHRYLLPDPSLTAPKVPLAMPTFTVTWSLACNYDSVTSDVQGIH